MKDRIIIIRKEKGYNQEQFANELNLSRNFINQVESGKRNPSERTILDICSKFNVSENWLRTGEGEMFITMSRDEELAEFFGKVQGSDDDSFMKLLMEVLKDLDVDEWEVLAKMAVKMANKMANKIKKD